MDCCTNNDLTWWSLLPSNYCSCRISATLEVMSHWSNDAVIKRINTFVLELTCLSCCSHVTWSTPTTVLYRSSITSIPPAAAAFTWSSTRTWVVRPAGRATLFFLPCVCFLPCYLSVLHHRHSLCGVIACSCLQHDAWWFWHESLLPCILTFCFPTYEIPWC